MSKTRLQVLCLSNLLFPYLFISCYGTPILPVAQTLTLESLLTPHFLSQLLSGPLANLLALLLKCV